MKSRFSAVWNVRIFVLILAGVSLVAPFQNCSGFNVDQLGSSSLRSSSGIIQGASGGRPDQILNVTNVNKETLSWFDATSTVNQRTFYTAVNASSGRRATVLVTMDPSTHSVTSVQGVGPSYFCIDSRQSPCANVVVPFGYPGGGGLAQNCASPIYYSGALDGSIDGIKSDLVCSSGLTPAIPLNATPWRRSYQGAYAAFVTGDGGAGSNVYTINGTENKNYLSYQNNPGAVPANTCDQNTINAIPCAEIQGPTDAVPGAPKSAGVWNGVYNDYAPTYHSFITMSVRAANAMATPGEFTDLGPVAWPANGYLAEDASGMWNETRGGGMGPVTGTSIVDKSGAYVYVFFADRSHGVHRPTDAGYQGRGSGMKVIRAPIKADKTVDPESFKSYFEGQFTDSALPPGFQKERIQDFYAIPGGRSDDIFGTPLKVYSRFQVANVANSAYYVGASLEEGRVVIRASTDLVHWGTALDLPSLASTDPAWWTKTKMLNVTFLNAAGTTTSSIDLNDFYLLGTDIGQGSLNMVRVSLRMAADGTLSLGQIGAVGKVNFQGDAQPLETVPSLVTLPGQSPFLFFATDWTSRCTISQPLTGAVSISNSSCLMTMQSDMRRNQYFPLGPDPTTQLNITNINREIQGSFRSLTASGADTDAVYEATNPVTGRSARVRVFIAPTSRAIIGARAVDHPYFCYDHARPACDAVPIPAGYANAGSMIRNCSSPIYLSGALNGSVAGITAEVSCP